MHRSAFRATVSVFPRPEILDPQGKAIAEALGRVGYTDVAEVRAGKIFRLELTAESMEQARLRLDEICDRLLSNPIVEDYTVEIEPGVLA